MSTIPPAPAVVSKVLRIGREPDNDLVVDLPTVSGHHARVVWEGRAGAAWIEDLGSSNGTAVGSPDRKAQRALVTPADLIYLGAYSLPAARIFEALGPPPVELRVGAIPVVTGRDPACDRVVDLPVVSGRHARLIRRNDGSVVVEDLGSANGTFVNGVRIDRVGTARAGDTIGLGSCALVLAVDPVAAPLTPGTIPVESRPVTLIRVNVPPAGAAVSSAGSFGSVLAAEWRAAWGRAWLWALILALGTVTSVLAVVTTGFDAGSLDNPETWASGTRALATSLSRLGLAAVGVGLVCGVGSGRPSSAGFRGWLARTSVSAAFGTVGCLLVWGAFLALTGLGPEGPAALGLLWLGSSAGMALGLILAAVAPRPVFAWAAVALLALPLWGSGGEGTVWTNLPGWARTPARLNPSRWAFEGLLLIEAKRLPARTAGVGDMVEPYFPVDTDRSGPRAVTLALAAMILGWGAAAAFIATEIGAPPERWPGL